MCDQISNTNASDPSRSIDGFVSRLIFCYRYAWKECHIMNSLLMSVSAAWESGKEFACDLLTVLANILWPFQPLWFAIFKKDWVARKRKSFRG